MQDQEYRSYLLRCWVERQMDEGQSAVWRYSLEEPGTGRRYGFASLVALMAFLIQEMGRSSSGGEFPYHSGLSGQGPDSGPSLDES